MNAFVPFLLSLVVLAATPVHAQLQLATVTGQVLAPDGRPAPGARVALLDRLGATVATMVAREDGGFTLAGVAPGDYSLRADADALRSVEMAVAARSGAALVVTLHLRAPGAERLDVRAESDSEAEPDVRISLAGDTVRRIGGRLHTRALTSALATAPGWSADDDGMLHHRGIDDGFLYVLDGVPVYERMDPRFGLGPDASTIGSVQILSGYIPPEYGLRSAAVVEVRSVAPTGDRWTGDVEASLGSEVSRSVSAVAGGAMGTRNRMVASASAEQSSRFLDAVDPDNLHNDGHAASGQAEYVFTGARDAVTVRGGGGRSRFDVPNSRDHETAGQDQRQAVAQAFGTGSWQRRWSAQTTSHLALYSRWSEGELRPGERDRPLRASSDRAQHRAGILAAISHTNGRHGWKLGFEAARLSLRERFDFAVTDAFEGEAAGLSEGALAYTSERPFTFRDRAERVQYSAYVQDSWRASPRFTVDVGLRFDHTRLLAREQQWSPRVGIAYRCEAGTVLRAAANRLYQPPQSEYLLLSSSEAARELSPFAGDAGGAQLRAERQTAMEAAVEHPFGAVRAQITGWRRAIRNQGDPNVFFGTTIIFPNSVARGRAEGIDVRLDLPRRRSWSGYLSYTLSRIVQFGPINGGLFLEDEMLGIGEGTRFVPDHDRRHVASAALVFDDECRGLGASITGRYQTGAPLEVDEDEYDALAARPGADRVDFASGRVRPSLMLYAVATLRLRRRGPAELQARVAVFNVTDTRHAFNFGNPFSGTHFGAPRTATVALRLAMR